MRNNILKYLEESSLKYPANICISDVNQSLTYKESVAKSYAISLQLRNYDSLNKPIVIFTKKSVNALSMIFSATMAGGYIAQLILILPKNVCQKYYLAFKTVLYFMTKRQLIC